jgi:NAD(P)-dependent dehydrogenase (short-subunit alcohol dehydrogenase family)
MADMLVTGCSSGIGQALVQSLVRRGHRVWGVARREPLLQSLQQELGRDRFLYSACDVADPSQVRRAIESIESSGFAPQKAYLNAGINPEVVGRPFTTDLCDQVMKVNFFGALWWIELLLPVFARQRGGQFIATSSLASFRGDARWVAYAASKAALSRSFESFRGRYTSQGILFTTIYLGAVETGMGPASRSPFRLTPARAAERIIAAAERGTHSITIPRYLRLLLEAMRVLPDSLFSKLVMRSFAEKEKKT